MVARLAILATTHNTDNSHFERLYEMGSGAVVALPSLLSTITPTNAEFLYQTARTLEAIVSGASNAIPALKPCTDDKNSIFQFPAKRALEAISSKGSLSQRQ